MQVGVRQMSWPVAVISIECPRKESSEYVQVWALRETRLCGGAAAVASGTYHHCGDWVILLGRQNWEQIVKILPKPCHPTVWNVKMWLGKIQTICCNILPLRQNSPALAVRYMYEWIGFRIGIRPMAGIVWNKSAYILFVKLGSPKIYFMCAQTFSCPYKYSFWMHKKYLTP